MNIGGGDKALTLVQSPEPEVESKKGRRSTYRYRGDDVEVVVEYVVTGVCSPDDEKCEPAGSAEASAPLGIPSQRAP